MARCRMLIDVKTLLILWATVGSAARNGTDATAAEVVRVFQETDEAFANPGQGWMTMRRLPDGLGRFP
jgi:hypothetical protein